MRAEQQADPGRKANSNKEQLFIPKHRSTFFLNQTNRSTPHFNIAISRKTVKSISHTGLKFFAPKRFESTLQLPNVTRSARALSDIRRLRWLHRCGVNPCCHWFGRDLPAFYKWRRLLRMEANVQVWLSFSAERQNDRNWPMNASSCCCRRMI